MSRYWHPHRTERQYIKLGDAFWQEAHFDGYLVTITSDDEADENICGCQHMEQAQRVAESYNKAKAYDDIIRQIERGSFDAGEALAFYKTNQDKIQANADPICVCGVAKSEHALAGCESFEVRR